MIHIHRSLFVLSVCIDKYTNITRKQVCKVRLYYHNPFLPSISPDKCQKGKVHAKWLQLGLYIGAEEEGMNDALLVTGAPFTIIALFWQPADPT